MSDHHEDMMKKTIGVFAHVDAGKTTFSEQILFHGKAIRERGRVDHKNTLFDNHALEKERGMTVFSEQGYFSYENDLYYIVDTPGHVDFSSEMERAVQVLDYAIIIISGIDGVQSHTERVYELLINHGVPIFFFVNKMDVDHSNFEKCFEEIIGLCPYAIDFQSHNFHENIAENDETLMAYYFEETYGEAFDLQVAKLIKNKKVMPVFKGSALKDEHIDEFMKALHKYTYLISNSSKLSGIVYKIRHDVKGTRETFVKLFAGSLKVRDHTEFGQITEIRKYQGKKYDSLNEMEAGDLCALVGLSAEIKDGFGDFKPYVFETQRTMNSKIIFDSTLDPRQVYKDLKILELEDPMLHLVYEPSHKEITLGVMGEIQLEVLKYIFYDRFAYDIDFHKPSIVYKETIENSVVGYGHFEPLKHYAEVHLMLEPFPGGGLVFESKCSLDALNQGQQNLVKHHIFEKKHRGVLTGSEITDLKITLLTGAGHEKHTSGGDFREATLRALRQGLEQANNILLEPFHDITIKVPAPYSGKILTDLSTFKAQNISSLNVGEEVCITAKVAVDKIRDYNMVLMNSTHGQGRMSTKFSGYERCDLQNEVVEAIAYDKDRDIDYPSSSVFCKKGKGFTVSSDQVKAFMHCL